MPECGALASTARDLQSLAVCRHGVGVQRLPSVQLCLQLKDYPHSAALPAERSLFSPLQRLNGPYCPTLTKLTITITWDDKVTSMCTWLPLPTKTGAP